MASYYDILGVPTDASRSVIRAAYREQAKRHHPDHHRGAEAAMVAINQAYGVLANSRERAVYDAGLRAAPASAWGRPPAARPPDSAIIDPHTFLVRVFRPLDGRVRQAVIALKRAIDELAYDIYDEVFLARFATVLGEAEDEIGDAERLLRSTPLPGRLAPAIALYGQGLRQIEDAMSDFADFTQNFDVDLLAIAIEILVQGKAQLDEARSQLS